MQVPNITEMIPGPFTIIFLVILFVVIVVGGPVLLAWLLEQMMEK